MEYDVDIEEQMKIDRQRWEEEKTTQAGKLVNLAMTAKEILYKKAQEKGDGFLSGQVSWIIEAMEEYGRGEAIQFAKQISGEGYQQYDEADRWIAPHNNYNVYTTAQLYELLNKKNGKDNS